MSHTYQSAWTETDGTTRDNETIWFAAPNEARARQFVTETLGRADTKLWSLDRIGECLKDDGLDYIVEFDGSVTKLHDKILSDI